MSLWAFRRQLFSIFIFICIFVIIIIVIYFLAQDNTPTCSDGIHNQGELAIDCGDVCQRSCVFMDDQVQILLSRFLKEGEDRYSAIALVRNNRNGFIVKDAYFEFGFYNREGKKLDVYRNTIDIFPTIDTPIFMPQRKIRKSEEITSVQFTFLDDLQFEKAPSIHKLKVEKHRLFDNEFESSAEAVVINDSQQTQREIDIYALVYDEDNNIIAASKTFINEIKEDEEVLVYFSWRHPFIRNNKKCKESVDANIVLVQPVKGLVSRATRLLSQFVKGDSVTIIVPNNTIKKILEDSLISSQVDFNFKVSTNLVESFVSLTQKGNEDTNYFLFLNSVISSDDTEKINKSIEDKKDRFFAIFTSEKDERKQENILKHWNPKYFTNQFDEIKAVLWYNFISNVDCPVGIEKLQIIANVVERK